MFTQEHAILTLLCLAAVFCAAALLLRSRNLREVDETPDEYIIDHSYAAMCCWEWFLELLDESYTPRDMLVDQVRAFRQRLGMHNCRYAILKIVPELNRRYEEARFYGYEDCFDWEFVPLIMRDGVDWSGEELSFKPDYKFQFNKI